MEDYLDQLEFCKIALESHIAFYNNAIQIDDIALEGFSNSDSKGTLLAASLNFIAVKTIETIKQAIRAFAQHWKDFINNRVDDILIPLGLHEENCKDSSNVCEFIRMNRKRIEVIQSALNKEVQVFYKAIKDNSTYQERYKVIEARANMLGADFERWTHNAKPVIIKVIDTKIQIRNIDSLVSNIGDCESTLSNIEATLRAADMLDNTTLIRIEYLMRLFVSTIKVYNEILTELSNTFNPINRVGQKIGNTVKSIIPSNRYNDDIDIEALT